MGNVFANDPQQGLKVTLPFAQHNGPPFHEPQWLPEEGTWGLDPGRQAIARILFNIRMVKGGGGGRQGGAKVCICLTLAFTYLSLLFASY